MFYKYFCDKCKEEFEIEHGSSEDPVNFLEEFSDCFDCKGEFLQKMGQVKMKKQIMKMRDHEGY